MLLCCHLVPVANNVVSCVVAANIAQSPSFATKGSLTVEDIERSTTIPLARLRWKRAIEHYIVQLQKNSK